MPTESSKRTPPGSIDKPNIRSSDEMSKEKKSFLNRIAAFTREKVNTRHKSTIPEPEVKVQKHHSKRKQNLKVGTPHLEHASVPLSEEEFDQIKHKSSFQREEMYPIRTSSRTALTTGKPNSNKQLIHKKRPPPLKVIPKPESLILKPQDLMKPVDKASPNDGDFLPKFKESRSLYQSWHFSVMAKGLMPTSSSELTSVSSLGNSSNSIDQLQASFDQRASARSRARESAFDSFYSVEESISALNEYMHPSDAIKEEEEPVRVFNLDSHTLDPNKSSVSLITDNESISSKDMTAESNTNTVSSVHSQDLDDEDEFVFTDFEPKSKCVFEKHSSPIEQQPEVHPITIVRPDCIVSRASNVPKQNEKTIGIQQLLTPSSRNAILLKTRIEYLEAREKSNWNSIIAGLPRFLPINYRSNVCNIYENKRTN